MKTLIVDDHPLFLEGLKNLLTLRGIEVVGTARDGMEAMDKARNLQPDIILMDIQMPKLDGLAATRLIKAELPDVKIVMLTMSDEDADLFEAIKSGASGYLVKTQDVDEFFSLFIGLGRGEAPLSSGLAGRILKEFARQTAVDATAELLEVTDDALSPRQIQVLTLAAKGMTYKEIGTKLYLAERTIKYHMGQILLVLNVKSRTEAIQYAWKRQEKGKARKK